MNVNNLVNQFSTALFDINHKVSNRFKFAVVGPEITIQLIKMCKVDALAFLYNIRQTTI